MTKKKKRRAPRGDIHLRIGEVLHRKVTQMMLLRRERSVSAYIRGALERQFEEDLKKFPDTRLTARPGAQIWRQEGEGRHSTFQPLTKTIGGERVWVIAPTGPMPRSIGGGYGYLVDLTVAAGEEGFEGREVVLDANDILGGIR